MKMSLHFCRLIPVFLLLPAAPVLANGSSQPPAFIPISQGLLVGILAATYVKEALKVLGGGQVS